MALPETVKGKRIFDKNILHQSKTWSVSEHHLRFLIDAMYIAEEYYQRTGIGRAETLINIKLFRSFLYFYDKLSADELRKIYNRTMQNDIGLSPISFKRKRSDGLWQVLDWEYYYSHINRINKHWEKRIANVY